MAEPEERHGPDPPTVAGMSNDYRGPALAFENELRVRMIALWNGAEQRGELPENADEFANMVVGDLFTGLSTGLYMLNQRDREARTSGS